MSYFNNLLLLLPEEAQAQGGDPAPLPHLGLLLGPKTAIQRLGSAKLSAADCNRRRHEGKKGNWHSQPTVTDRHWRRNEGTERLWYSVSAAAYSDRRGN